MPQEYEVQSGDCIDSIALQYGFFPGTIWDHPANAALKNLRKDPNVLFPGDKLTIPDKQIKQMDLPTEQKKRFKRKGVPAKLRLRFLKTKDKPPEDPPAESSGDDEDSNYSEPDPPVPSVEYEPIANADYRLDVDGVSTTGQSDGDGKVSVSIAPNARSAVITFYPGTPDQKVIPLGLGEMDPIDTVIGARKRLVNLGFPVSVEENVMTPELAAVIGQFQQMNDLKVDGALNDETKAKLKEKHGC